MAAVVVVAGPPAVAPAALVVAGVEGAALAGVEEEFEAISMAILVNWRECGVCGYRYG